MSTIFLRLNKRGQVQNLSSTSDQTELIAQSTFSFHSNFSMPTSLCLSSMISPIVEFMRQKKNSNICMVINRQNGEQISSLMIDYFVALLLFLKPNNKE
jgi:hypothetical protein